MWDLESWSVDSPTSNFWRLIHGLELATYCLDRGNIDFQTKIIMG